MTKYKVSAFIGVLMMGISSFMACLAQTALMSNIGSGFLILSIVIMSYAFARWQP